VVRETAPRAFSDLLGATPVHNHAARSERRGENDVVVRVPLRRRWFMGPPLSWVLPLSRERVVSLDRLGAEVWEYCDGQRTTRQIIDDFAGRHQLSFHESRVSVCSYLQQLIKRGLVVLVGQPSQEEAG